MPEGFRMSDLGQSTQRYKQETPEGSAVVGAGTIDAKSVTCLSV